MFFAPELLTIRRKGKFSKCWLAAKLSENSFLKKFRRDTIVEINVPLTCKNIMNCIVSEDRNVKFSLSLSSSLMLGIARIFYYQAKICLQHQFDLQRSIIAKPDPNSSSDKKPKRVRKLPAEEDLFLLPLADVPMVTDINFRDNVVNEADITIVELDVNHIHKTEMRAADQLDFGALTNEQLEAMLETDGSCLIATDLLRLLPGSVIPPGVSLPEIEIATEAHVFKRPEVRERKEKSGNGIDAATKQFLDENGSFVEIPAAEASREPVQVSSLVPRLRPLGTPTKHKLSPPSRVGTPPIKRRNLGTEFDAEFIEGLISAEPPTAVRISDAVPASDNSMVLDSLNESVFERLKKSTKKNKKKLKVDKIKEISLIEPSSDARDYLSQMRALSVHEDVIRLLIPPAEKLFTSPSVRLPWAKCLLVNYEMIILEPISEIRSRRRRGPSILEAKGRLPIGETVREPADTSAQERSGGLSSKVGQLGVSSDEASTKDRTGTLDHISIEEPSTSKAGLQTLAKGIEGAPDASSLDFPADIPLPDLAVEPKDLPRESAVESLTNLPKNVRSIVREWSENRVVRTGSRSSYESSDKSRTIDITSKTFHENGISKQPQVSSSSSSCHCSGQSRDLSDLIGRLESLWAAHPVVRFKELCPVDKSNKKAAALMFVNLLELHKVKQVKLTQATRYNDIYIQKYAPGF